MNYHRHHLLALLLCLLSWGGIYANPNIDIEYSEPLQQLVIDFDGESYGNRKPLVTSASTVTFTAFGREFVLQIDENRALLDSLAGQNLPESLGVFRGKIRGNSDSWVRITIQNDIPSGTIWDGQEMFAIDIVDGSSAIFKLNDMTVEDGAFSCALTREIDNAGEFLKTIWTETAEVVRQQKAPGAIMQMDVAAMGDGLFTALKGVNARSAIMTRMNNVDGFFSAQLGVQFNVTRVDTFSAAQDPFTNETDPGALIDELSSYRNNDSTQFDNGLSHLFTGRDLDGTTVGIAFGGSSGAAICSRRFGAGLTQATHSLTFDSLIVAHELGHNFGAPHDGTPGSACEAEVDDFIMSPRISGSDVFSTCSITQMQDDIGAASCISALPSADVSIAAGSSSATVLLGDTVVVSFDLNSNGTNPVTNVVADVTIPANVSLQSAVSSAGSCTNGAGNVSCTIGTIPAGSGETLTLTVVTPSVGQADLSSTVSANTDANTNNNQSTASLTIDPAVDIVVTGTTAVQVDPNASATVNLTVANASSITATNVLVTVTPNSGIEFDSASWDSGTCDISNSIVTCDAASLVAQASGQLSLNLTGVSVGQQSYGVSVSTSETDRNMSNNNVSGQVTVGNTVVAAPPVNSADSGGGSMGISFLSLLTVGSLLSLRRRRFSRCDVSKGHN